MQIGKVAIERTRVAALDEDIGAAAKDERAEAVPFGLVEQSIAGGSASASFASIGSIGGGIGNAFGKTAVYRNESRFRFRVPVPVPVQGSGSDASQTENREPGTGTQHPAPRTRTADH